MHFCDEIFFPALLKPSRTSGFVYSPSETMTGVNNKFSSMQTCHLRAGMAADIERLFTNCPAAVYMHEMTFSAFSYVARC